jgi:CsoR family transcriptional regulator, copper-sensing transcriptional repressor
MKLGDSTTKEKITARLRRIEGQVRGVENMVAEDRDCHEILQQLNSIRSAVQSTSKMFLQEVASDCLLNADTIDRSKREQLLAEMLDLIGKV